MMLIFPLIYLSAFIFALRGIIKGDRQEVLLFLIFGLSIYITALSITFDLGFRGVIGFFQTFKEILIVVLLGSVIWNLKTRIRFHILDYAVLAYFSYTLLYALLPIGGQRFLVRLLTFKSISFFPLIYFCGRLIPFRDIYLSKYFHFILYLSVAAGVLVVGEFLASLHFQTFTGYADFYLYVYNFEPTGEYGLSWTFETETGMKRFASFFANPLEHAAATLLALAVLAALYTRDDNKIKADNFSKIALLFTLISITLAISRAPMLGYFVMIYFYALLTGKKRILNVIHLLLATIVIYFIYLLNDEDIQEFVVSTLNFTNSSSVGHLLEWIEGINAMIEHPLGLGLGTSGRVAGSLGGNTGGENQFIIIGVQSGIIAMGIYLAIYIGLLVTCWKWFYRLKGKERQLCLALLLMKIGFLIPSLTSELESSAYISYITWFFSGSMINIIASHTRTITLQRRSEPDQ